MKTIDVNVIPSVVANNVQLISKIGSNLGTQFFKVEVRFAWQGNKEGFERDKKAIESGEKKGFMLNRSPLRLLLKNFLIAGTVLVKDPLNDDEMGIAVNPHEDGTCDLFLPISEQTLREIDKTTADAVGEAIRGERDHFFLDGKFVAKLLNDRMRREISYLEEIVTTCNKMKVTLLGDITENDNKAKKAEEAWINSAIPPKIDMPGGTGTIVTVNKTTED